MKFYLASNFSLVHRVEIIAETLKKKGHEITCEWWHRDYKQLPIQDDDEWYRYPEVRDISERNFRGIRECECLILIAPTDVPTKFNGANIELGYALALKIHCFSCGKLERSAMYVPVHRCMSIDEILESDL